MRQKADFTGSSYLFLTRMVLWGGVTIVIIEQIDHLDNSALYRCLFSGNRHITMPDGTRRDHFLKWIESLADRQTPAWLGLPNNAEKVLLTTRGTDLISKLLKMQQLEDDDELAYSKDESLPNDPAQVDGRPSWMKTLHNRLVNFNINSYIYRTYYTRGCLI